MPRIPYADPAGLSPEAKAIYDGASIGVLRVLANAADSLVPWVQVVQGVRSSPDLDPRLRELVLLRILTSVDAPAESAAHEGLARAAGADDAQIAAARAGAPVDGDPGGLVSLIGDLFAGVEPDDARIAAAVEALSPRAVVEAVMIAGIYTTIGRLTELIGPGAGRLDES